MRFILDTSILIDGCRPPSKGEAAISIISLAELHHGVLVARNPAQRELRLARLSVIEHEFEPIPVTAPIARAYGRCAAAVARHGRNPRPRAFDLLIAATALTVGASLCTRNVDDFRGLEGLVSIRPADLVSD
jgi:predicted nucleic acid-binding protein